MWERTFIKFCEGCVTASTGLPAELYPQMWESAFINFFEFSQEGYATVRFGLPAELYPHIHIQL